MILGIGCDIVDLNRAERLLTEKGKTDRIFTTEEQLYCDSRGCGRIASYAVRFAAKEAVSKALGCGIGAVSWCDIEVLKGETGRPYLKFYGHAAFLMDGCPDSRMHISLSHGATCAIAYAVWEGEENGRDI